MEGQISCVEKNTKNMAVYIIINGMPEKTHKCPHCDKTFSHQPGVSRHKKTCRNAIIAELQEKTQLDAKMTTAEISIIKDKMNNLDLLNTEYGDVPDVVSWGDGLKFTLRDIERVIEYGPREFIKLLGDYIAATPQRLRPIKIINKQNNAGRFKMFMREIENGKAVWKQYIGDKGFDTFVRFTTYKLGNRMRMPKYIGEWLKEHPAYEIDYSKDEKDYWTLRRTFDDHYDDKVAPAYALDIMDQFYFKKGIQDEDE
jgi:hypothetical protein